MGIGTAATATRTAGVPINTVALRLVPCLSVIIPSEASSSLMVIKTVPFPGNPVLCTRLKPLPWYTDGTNRFTYTVELVKFAEGFAVGVEYTNSGSAP
jgi:hypothetical protein